MEKWYHARYLYLAVLMKGRGGSTQGFHLPLQWSGIAISLVPPCSVSESSSTREQKPNGKRVDSAKTLAASKTITVHKLPWVPLPQVNCFLPTEYLPPSDQRSNYVLSWQCKQKGKKGLQMQPNEQPFLEPLLVLLTHPSQEAHCLIRPCALIPTLRDR